MGQIGVPVELVKELRQAVARRETKRLHVRVSLCALLVFPMRVIRASGAAEWGLYGLACFAFAMAVVLFVRYLIDKPKHLMVPMGEQVIEKLLPVEQAKMLNDWISGRSLSILDMEQIVFLQNNV